MKKRGFLIVVLVAAISCSSVFATGIGIQGSLNTGDSTVGGGAITFKLNKVPYVFALSFNSTPYVGLTFDRWLGNPTIAGGWKWFYGIGGALGVSIPSHALGLRGGFRGFIGTNIFIARSFEIFAQVAWQPEVSVWVSGNSGFNPVWFNFPADFGVRFWF